jgi:hypothetical protein
MNVFDHVTGSAQMDTADGSYVASTLNSLRKCLSTIFINKDVIARDSRKHDGGSRHLTNRESAKYFGESDLFTGNIFIECLNIIVMP